MSAKEIESHRFYSILHDAEREILTLDWKEESAGMADSDFNEAALRFAELAKAHKTPHLRVVTANFEHDISDESMKWRKQHVIPLYDEADVRKIAFEVGANGDKIPDSVEDGRETRSFETSEEVFDWFSKK